MVYKGYDLIRALLFECSWAFLLFNANEHLFLNAYVSYASTALLVGALDEGYDLVKTFVFECICVFSINCFFTLVFRPRACSEP